LGAAWQRFGDSNMISVNLATFEGRKHILPKVIESLKRQTVKPDIIRVYANDYTPEIEGVHVYTGRDLKDNGKFAFLPYTKDEYFFSCDDDLEYPEDYIEKTLRYLKKYPNHVITYHGRRLLGKGRNYYRGHKHYACLRDVKGNWEIDVPGTGVSAFHTDLIKFDPLLWDKYKMSDLMFALECAKREVPILMVQHHIFWLKSLLSNSDYSIYSEQVKECTIQNQVADEIWDLKHYIFE